MTGWEPSAGRTGTSILIRNHEINNPGPPFGDAAKAYDGMAQSGTTTIEVTPTGRVVKSFTSLNGTQMNCSGGQMPWRSWITCEETVNGPDVGPDFTGVSNVPLEQRHGFIFEVPVDGVSNREPITNAGRFAHESVAFDPKDGILYLTEDNFGFPSGFYRYIPRRNPMHTGRLDNRGRLQMLAVKGHPNIDLAAAQPKGARYKVKWVDIDDPAPTLPVHAGPACADDEQRCAHLRRQAGIRPGRGLLLAARGIGVRRQRRVLRRHPGRRPGGDFVRSDCRRLRQRHRTGLGVPHAQREAELLFESPGADTLDFPDNVTTSNRGTLILCEDNVNDNFLRGLTRNGRLFDVALNRMVSSTGVPRFNDEFAGTTFSPNGRTLFVNIQASRGITFAIWGPWRAIGV